MQLREIFDRTNTDKGHRHGYEFIYEFLLRKFIDRECVSMEIGVMSGASISAWTEYLPLATIVGVDKNKQFEWHEPQVKLEYGDQSDNAFLQNLVKKYGGFDIIIDDGSHLPKDQQRSFEMLFCEIAAPDS